MCKKERQSWEVVNMLNLLLKVPSIGNKVNFFVMTHRIPNIQGFGYLSVIFPSMLEREHKEWNGGLNSNGGYLPDGDTGWNNVTGENKELNMWDVVSEMLVAALGKVRAMLLLMVIDLCFLGFQVIL